MAKVELPAEFFALYHPLMYFVALDAGLVPGDEPFSTFLRRAVASRQEIRDAFVRDVAVADRFIATTPNLSSQDAAQIRAWRDHHVSAQFIVAKYAKEEAIFVTAADPPVAYQVRPLMTPFRELFGPELPVITTTLLLPFQNIILADGIYSTLPVQFGAGWRRSLKAALREIDADGGPIQSLPAQASRGASDEDLLRTYMKTRESWDQFVGKIDDLLARRPDLIPLYDRERGRLAARRAASHLKGLGFTDVWFAFLGEVIVTSAKTEAGLRKAIREVAPADMQERLHLHHQK